MSFEPVVYRLVVEPANPNCVAIFLRPSICRDHLQRPPSLTKPLHQSAGASSYPPPLPCLNRLERFEAARQDWVDSICLAECPVRPLVKSRCTERIVERGWALSNG